MTFMPNPLLSPSALVELTRYAVGQVVGVVATAATVPVRVMGLLGQAELLVSRITLIADDAETLVERLAALAGDADEAIRETKPIMAAAALAVREAEAVAAAAASVVGSAAAATDAATTLVGDAAGLTGAAGAVVVSAGSTAAEAQELLDGYSDTLRKAAPLAARFVGELTPEEITAAIKMVDALPELREHLVRDVMPLLGKLDQVGPDLHSLLEVTQDLHLAIAGLPGLKMLRRRGEEKIEEESANGR